MLFTIGVLMPFVISDFVDVTNPPESSIMNPLITLFDEGVSIFTFNLNLFGFLGETLQTAIVNYLSIFAFIPNILLIPMAIIMIIGVVYTIIKMLPTT